jgi:hypothetical protein
MNFARHSSRFQVRLVHLALVSLVLLPSLSHALPICYDFDRTEQVTDSDAKVLSMMSQPSDQQYHRALVTGVVIERLSDRTQHNRLLIDLNGDGRADLEVIHQADFGTAHAIVPGMTITACGDFKGVPMDGVKGFIHWTHCNPGTQEPNHPQGFFAVNGVTYGQQAPAGEPACDPNKP